MDTLHITAEGKTLLNRDRTRVFLAERGGNPPVGRRLLAELVATERFRKTRRKGTFEGSYTMETSPYTALGTIETFGVRFERDNGSISADIIVTVSDSEVERFRRTLRDFGITI